MTPDETKTDISLVRKEIEILRSETKKELALMENRLLWKVFGLMAIQTRFLAALTFFV